ncbi:unnamed protein product [Phaedon cochleariae]|uniref:Uncharacterized protein n=1 Tax=Phaedon cochleariae TaxID=80249 RepID=A0A9N9SGF7_PHACE|nr:unnamed protein product [Phaedon cochleariae]
MTGRGQSSGALPFCTNSSQGTLSCIHMRSLEKEVRDPWWWRWGKSKVSFAISPSYKATKHLMPASLTACGVESGRRKTSTCSASGALLLRSVVNLVFPWLNGAEVVSHPVNAWVNSTVPGDRWESWCL